MYIRDKRGTEENQREGGTVGEKPHERAVHGSPSLARSLSIPSVADESERVLFPSFCHRMAPLPATPARPSSRFEPGLFRFQTVFAETSYRWSGIFQAAWFIARLDPSVRTAVLQAPAIDVFVPSFLLRLRSYGGFSFGSLLHVSLFFFSGVYLSIPRVSQNLPTSFYSPPFSSRFSQTSLENHCRLSPDSCSRIYTRQCKAPYGPLTAQTFDLARIDSQYRWNRDGEIYIHQVPFEQREFPYDSHC